MEFQQPVVCFTIILLCRCTQAIPDKSLIWAAHERLLYYSPRVEDWTNNRITPIEFGQSVTGATLSGTQSVYGIAGDIPTRHFVSSDRTSQHIVIYDLNGQQARYFHIGTSKDIGQLAIDWLGRNVYWADTGYGWIAMKKLPASINQHNSADPNFRLVADKYLERPTGIVVHPEKFFLFWTDTGSNPKIERSDLIGGKRTIIIWHSLITPTTLCIDQSADRLYWSDPARGTIEYSDFDGNGRRILLSDPDLDYYGIAVFQESLIYTAPSYNRTGYVSLKENTEGEHVQSSIQFLDIKFYHIMVYASELQEISSEALCKDVDECDQICLHMEQDAGFTCLCNDGYELSVGRSCQVDEKVLERHIMFTNGNNICAVAISVLGLKLITPAALDIHCDVVKNDTVVTRFAADMTTKMIFYTNGETIFKQTAFKDDRVSLYDTNRTIKDLDYDWKTGQLYWTESADGFLYHIDVNGNDDREPDKKKLSEFDITNVAVDPHNGKVFWISKEPSDSGTRYTLNAWNIAEDEVDVIPASLLSRPTDLEYDRLKNRLLWNDDDGHIGIINTDGTGEKKFNSATTGEKRHAITVYKNFIMTTTAENRQFDVIYELDPQSMSPLNLPRAYDGPVQDFHVFESALQPSNLEPCEVDNGGCEHICLPGNDLKCACFLGYVLDEDNTSCKTDTLSDNFFVILDTVHHGLYQIDQETKTPYAIEIDPTNEPSSLSFDSRRKTAIWVDTAKHAVKKKRLGSSEEIAIRSGVDDDAAVTVDVSTGNIYISTGGEIIVVSPSLDTTTVVDSEDIVGTIGKIALNPESGLMSWFESGGSLRIMIGNMDGTNVRPITVTMDTPEDIAFDLEIERSLYWCDSGFDKIEKIDTQSLATTNIYKDRGLKPVAIDIVGDVIYLVPKQQRKIVQINKSNGLQQKDVFESPLFGSFNNFFLSRNDVRGHEGCESCNGGCSNLCLPIGKSKRCACRDGVTLKDESTCQYADVCPKESYLSVSGLKDLRECCPNLPGAVCQPECQAGFKSKSSLHCKNGVWNASLDKICTKDVEPPSDNKIIYFIGAAGGAVLLIVLIVVGVCMCRREKRKSSGERDPTRSEYVGHTRDHAHAHGYATANGVLSPDPPQSAVEPEEYDYLNENDMLPASKLRVVMPPSEEDLKKQVDRKNSTSSGRYSKFPEFFLTAMSGEHTQEEPKPDFNDYKRNDDADKDDGYLRASSTGSASYREDHGYLRASSTGSASYQEDAGYLRASSTGSPSYRDDDGYLRASLTGSASYRDASNGSFAGQQSYSGGHFEMNYMPNSSKGQVAINRNEHSLRSVPQSIGSSRESRADGHMTRSGSYGHSGHM